MIKRILLFPIYIVLVTVRLLFGLMVRMSDWIFYVLGGLFLLTTIFSYYFALEDAAGLRSMIIGSGIMFLIPQAAAIIEDILEVCTMRIGDLMGGNR